MKTRLSTFLVLAPLLAGCAASSRNPEPARAAEVDRRGDHVMGFEHEKTSHHFRLSRDGGAIEAEAQDPSDTESRDRIREHFAHIAAMFSEGNFRAPMLIHGEEPPGVPVMKRLKDRIRYEFEPTDRGGRVRIRASEPEAIAAIHEFLRYQIRDHRTGDPLAICDL
jgi:hypothetical protein